MDVQTVKAIVVPTARNAARPAAVQTAEVDAVPMARSVRLAYALPPLVEVEVEVEVVPVPVVAVPVPVVAVAVASQVILLKHRCGYPSSF